jgi:hypothetical protein
MFSWTTDRPLGRWDVSYIFKSRQGCALCEFLYGIMSIDGHTSHLQRDEEPRYNTKEVSLYIRSYDGEPGCRLNIQVVDVDSTMSSQTIICDGTVILTKPFTSQRTSHNILPGAMPHLTIPILGRKLAEVAAWPLLRKWVGYCVRHHRHENRQNLIPAAKRTDITQWISNFRLVDVRKKCVVRACKSAQYVALSYVWGGSEPVRLNSQNIKELMTEGGLSRVIGIPKNFHDAVYVTEQLEMDYIWIDALCIQHDDVQDLDLQIKSMDKVYQEATITVVSLSPNADCEIPGTRPGTRNSISLHYSTPGVNLMYARPGITHAIGKSNWDTRGWTLQEKFFSKRILFFTPYQDLLRDYFRRNLTHDSDILSAFSGILSSLENKLGLSVFGLPERIFDISLLWHGDVYAIRRPQFPSWSWCGWVAKEDRTLSWLIVEDNRYNRANAWVQPSTTEQASMIEIIEQPPIFEQPSMTKPPPRSEWLLPRRPREWKFVKMPQPLKFIRELALTGPPRSHVLEFEADTFSDLGYLPDKVQTALDFNLQNARSSGPTAPPILEFIVMSGSKLSDSWHKRRQGAVALLPRPGAFPISYGVNLMLIKINGLGISEMVWVFSAPMDYGIPPTVRKVIYLA